MLKRSREASPMDHDEPGTMKTVKSDRKRGRVVKGTQKRHTRSSSKREGSNRSLSSSHSISLTSYNSETFFGEEQDGMFDLNSNGEAEATQRLSQSHHDTAL